MVQLIPWLQVTIPGFVYLTAIFFFLLALSGKYDLNFTGIKEYIPYIAILILFFSYVIGYTIHLTFEKIIFFIYPGLNKPLAYLINIHNRMSKDLYKSYDDSYSNLILFRHLFIATILLGISLFNWFRKGKLQRLKWNSFITCIIFALLFLIAYFVAQESVNKLNNLMSSY